MLGEEQAQREILSRIEGSFGTAAGAAIAAMLDDAVPQRAGWFATVVGLLSLYFGLSGVYRQIDDEFALGLYLGKAAVGSAFGAAGSIVVVLLWSYWSAQLFFFGLEFTHVYAQERE